MNRYLLIRNIEAAVYPSYSTEDWFGAFETQQEAVDCAILERGIAHQPSYRYYVIDLKELFEAGVIPEGKRLEFLEDDDEFLSTK